VLLYFLRLRSAEAEVLERLPPTRVVDPEDWALRTLLEEGVPVGGEGNGSVEVLPSVRMLGARCCNWPPLVVVVVVRDLDVPAPPPLP